VVEKLKTTKNLTADDLEM